MKQYKDFQGKTLDAAINEACVYFGVEREKLEIEIINDAKGGIFGLVGAKKASIRAARVQLDGAVSALLESPGSTAERSGSDAGKQPPKAALPEEKPGKAAKPAVKSGKSAGQIAQAADGTRSPQHQPAGVEAAEREKRPEKGKKTKPAAPEQAKPSQREREQQRAARSEQDKGDRKDGRLLPAQKGLARRRTEDAGKQLSSFPPHAGEAEEGFKNGERDDLPDYSLEQCNREELAATVEKVVLRLVEPIVGQTPCRVTIARDRVRISLDCDEGSELLVGWEGQTLAAVQYIASRIVSKELGGGLRLQIDAGDYRERQDTRLRELALSLAARVKQTRRPQSTRPLSAYQRRIVHLALEADPMVTTRSKGEGAQRRVVVYLNKDMDAQTPASVDESAVI